MFGYSLFRLSLFIALAIIACTASPGVRIVVA